MARRPVTLREIARRTGVHESTVSRALNARTRHLVNDKVAARIAETAQTLGYRPNFMAAALRTHRSMTAGAILRDLTDPIAARLLAALEAQLRDAGYALLVATATPDGFPATRDALEGRGVDGLVLLDGLGEAAEEDTDTAALPTVRPGELWDGGETGIGLAVAHLVRRGHRAIGHLAGPAADPAARARLAGFRTAMTAAGLFVSAVESCAGWNEAAGAQGAAALLDRRPNLTALVAADDRLALGALDTLAARGLTCPAGLSLTGFGDLPAAARGAPSLTSVACDIEELGRRLVERMLARLADPGNAPQPAEPLAVELIERRSTAAPRAS